MCYLLRGTSEARFVTDDVWVDTHPTQGPGNGRQGNHDGLKLVYPLKNEEPSYLVSANHGVAYYTRDKTYVPATWTTHNQAPASTYRTGRLKIKLRPIRRDLLREPCS